MRVAVVVNTGAGKAKKDHSFAGELRVLLANHGLEATIVCAPNEDVVESLRASLRSHRVECFIGAGGDGTISSVAEACYTEHIPLGVLPLGTHNHFAKDIGLSPGLNEAIDVISLKKIRSIDIAEVNSRFFINNASIGAYPRVIEQREELRSTLGLRKQVALLTAALRVFAHPPLMQAQIELEGRQSIVRTTPFIFIGNNSYEGNFFSVRLRSTLESGKLCIYTAKCETFQKFIRLAWLAFWGRLNQSNDFESHLAENVTIRLAKAHARVAKDGEVMRMDLPLKFTMHHKGLNVLVS